MSYDPFEHRPSAREIVAGWLVCLGIVGLALAFTAGREAPAAAAAQPVAARAGDPDRRADSRRSSRAGRAESFARQPVSREPVARRSVS
jgi:hypothetical protein